MVAVPIPPHRRPSEAAQRLPQMVGLERYSVFRSHYLRVIVGVFSSVELLFRIDAASVSAVVVQPSSAGLAAEVEHGLCECLRDNSAVFVFRAEPGRSLRKFCVPGTEVHLFAAVSE